MAPTTDQVDDLLAFCRSDGRIAPFGVAWRRLWQLLPHAEGHKRPPAAITAGGASHATEEEKRHRLAQQIRWAAEHGAFAQVEEYLRALPLRQWTCEAPRPR